MRHTSRRLYLPAASILILMLATISAGVAGQTVAEPQPVADADTQADEPSQESTLALKLAQAVAVADFNGDGVTDVAAADFFGDVVLVRQRDYEGRLTTTASLAAGRGPRSIVAGDFDLDGNLDIAVASFLSGDVRIFAGHGNGQFSADRTLSLEPGLASLSGSDVEADGDTDLVAANFLTGRVSLLVSGGGAFEGERTIGRARGTTLLVSRDLNGDSVADLVAVDASGTSGRLLVANGVGSFEDAGVIEVPGALPEDLQSAVSTAGDTFTLRITAGNGQAARAGTVLPETIVVEARGVDGTEIVGSPIVFSTVAGIDTLPQDTQSTNSEGQAAVRVVAADVPGNQLVAAAVPGVGVVVAGAVSALLPADYRSAAPAGTALASALDAMNADDEVQAVADLMAAEAAAGGAGAPDAGAPASDLARRAINQLLLIGPLAPGPDLVETAVSEPPAVVTLKGKFVVTDTALNQGTTVAGASITRYYLSIDGVQKTTLLGGGGRNVPSLNPGIDSTGSDTVSVPASARPRFYFLLACADDRVAVVEDNETNNCRASSGQVQVKAADLVVSAMSEPPANVTEGNTFTVSDTTTNNGDATAGPSTTRYFLSLDKKKTAIDVLVASRGVPSLGPGLASSSGGVTATASAAPGTYYLIACADDLKKVAEQNLTKTGEKNNCFVSTGQVTVVPGTADGGPLDNGALHNGRIAVAGEIDEWTFSATAGQRISVHIGEIVDNNDFRPWIRLLSPTDSVLGDVAGVSATVIDDIVAPSTGTYRVRVGSFDSGFDGTGTYRLTMTRTPGPITVSPGDQGGPLTNGAIHEGQILQGDVDVWTFTATAGERLSVHIGEITDTDDFRPWIRVWTPAGGTVGDAAGVAATVVDDIVAPQTGTYLVQVATFDTGFDGEGTYRLTMTKTPGPITVSPGDQGGPLTNGAIHEGQILQGDVDVWTFTATAGERLSVHIGEITDTDDFRPWIRIWTPNGGTVGDTSGVAATVVDDIVAPQTGTYLVQVATFDTGFDGEGTYRLTMTKTPGPITVSPGDQGGPLTNGATHEGEILQGDVDVWTFTATAGERLSVHIGEITDTDDFRPWIRIWTPAGGTVGDASGVAATVVDDIVAPQTGTYLVQVATFDTGFDGEGTYRLTMTKTPGPITVSPGDQGGGLTNGGTHAGDIVVGDVDVWTITAAAGEHITVTITETADLTDFRPWIRLWAPNGATLGDTSGVSTTQINAVAPAAGTYLVLVASFDTGFDGTGSYDLVVNVTPP